MTVTPDSGRLRALIRDKRELLWQVLAAAGVTAAWVFGSVARGDAGPSSDIDLFIEFADNVDGFHRMSTCGQLMDELPPLLGVDRVDVMCEEIARDDVLAAAVDTEPRWDEVVRLDGTSITQGTVIVGGCRIEVTAAVDDVAAVPARLELAVPDAEEGLARAAAAGGEVRRAMDAAEVSCGPVAVTLREE